jgi:hypothetical protein
MWRQAVRWLAVALLVGLTGCGYSGDKNKNSDKDRPKPAAGQ